MKRLVRGVVASAVSLAALVALSASAVRHYYKYCGLKSTSIASLTSSKCWNAAGGRVHFACGGEITQVDCPPWGA